MTNQVNVENVLKQAEQINNAVAKHNKENSKYEGFREATKGRLLDELKAYNEKYGTDLTLEDTEKLRNEYVSAVSNIQNETEHLAEVLKAVDENDLKKVSELTGLDISQDTIKMPRIDIDMEEMEKQADRAYEQAVGDATGVNEAVNGAIDFSNKLDQKVGEQQVEDDSEEVQEEEKSAPEIPSFFAGNKVSSQSDAGKKESQTKENTVPNFSEVANKEVEEKEDSKPSSAPDFSKMFSGLNSSGETKQEEKPTKEEDSSKDGNIGKFIGGFNFEPQAKETSSKEEEDKVANAIKNQKPQIPQFNFGSIDEDDE